MSFISYPGWSWKRWVQAVLALGNAAALDGTEVTAISQSGVAVKTTLADIAAYVLAGGGSVSITDDGIGNIVVTPSPLTGTGTLGLNSILNNVATINAPLHSNFEAQGATGIDGGSGVDGEGGFNFIGQAGPGGEVLIGDGNGGNAGSNLFNSAPGGTNTSGIGNGGRGSDNFFGTGFGGLGHGGGVNGLHGLQFFDSAFVDQSAITDAPSTGDTITMLQYQLREIIAVTGTLATLTVTLPPNPNDQQIAGISFNHIVTSLTINAPGGATVSGGPSAAVVGGRYNFMYHQSDTTWYPAT